MARKNLLTALTANKLTAVNSTPSPTPVAPPPGMVGRGALGVVTRSIDDLAARAEAARQLEAQLTGGQIVVEIDTALIDPSFVQDRMAHDEEAYQILLAAVAEQGQISPVLVRPHPTAPDRYQIAFGHRRLRVAQALGRKLRAVVRRLSDRELILAQGQENSARTDLSFIERARFAERLEAAGYDRPTIMSALAVDKTTVSRMITVVHRVPGDVIEAIGPAPSIGRDRWIELSEQLGGGDSEASWRSLIQAAAFARAGSDERFDLLMKQLSQTPEPSARPRRGARAGAEPPTVWTGSNGTRVVSMARTGRGVAITIDRDRLPGFGEYLSTKMPDLLRDYRAKFGEATGGGLKAKKRQGGAKA